MPAIGQIACLNQIAVGQQHRTGHLVRPHGHPIGGHDVGPVGKISDTAKPFRLALGAEDTPGLIQPFQLGIGCRCYSGCDFKLARIARHAQAKPSRTNNIVIRAKGSPIQAEGQKLQLLPLKIQIRRAIAMGRISGQPQPGNHLGCIGQQIKFKGNVINQKCGRLIIA